MKSLFRLLVPVIAGLSTAALPAATIGVKVYDKGSDGEERYYDIRCPDDRSIMVVHRFKQGQVCFYLKNGEEEFCLATNDLDAAGQRACSMR
jgi:hypothetical protein